MTNDLSTTSNQHLKGIYEGLIKDDAYKNLTGEDIATQTSKLKEIFTRISDNDVSSTEKAHLTTAAQKLSGEISTLEGQMEDIEKQIAAKEKEIQKKIKEIADIATKTKKESSEMEDDHYVWVQRCVSDVIYDYSKGKIGRDAVQYEIQSRINRDPNLSEHKNAIDKYISNLNSQESAVKALSDEAADIADKVGSLRQQFGTLSCAKSLIDKTLGQIGNTETTYTNSDYNSAVPTYSLDKTAIVSNLFTNEKYNVASTNTAYIAGATEETHNANSLSADKIKEKYKNYFGVAATSGVDAYSADNKAVKALGKAMDDKNFISDLLNSKMTNGEIVKFMQENFAGAQIKFADDGSLSVPYGHGSDAQAIFSKFTKFINNDLKDNRGLVENVWDKDKGNTLKSNEQLKALGDNYETILKNLAKGNPPFSFKEAMYALFDSKNGLFKNSGINYNLAEQGSNPTYSIDAAGDTETLAVYKGIAKKIEEYWGVQPSNNSAVKINPYDDKKASVSERTDPLTFTKDGVEYAFIIDRDGNNAITDTTELLGAKEGTSWLEDLKSLDLDGDGKLTGEELKNLKVLKSDYKDNAKTTMKDGKYLRETINDINYTVTDAAKLGIEEIDLTNLEEKVGVSTGKFDINGSEIFEDNFTFKMNGEEITASRKDDTSEFMKTVYGDAAGKSFSLGLTDEEVEKTVDANYQKFDSKVKSGHDDFFNNIDLYDKYVQVKDDLNNSYAEALDRMGRYDEVHKMRGVHKVDSESVNYKWGNIYPEIKSIALSEGININSSDATEQLKGIWYHEPNLSAREVVDKYTSQENEVKTLEEARNTSSTVLDAVIKCLKAGVATSASEIKELISSGKATTADDIVKYLQENKNKTE